jgi:uncharacterized protein YecE (DUF72 family)
VSAHDTPDLFGDARPAARGGAAGASAPRAAAGGSSADDAARRAPRRQAAGGGDESPPAPADTLLAPPAALSEARRAGLRLGTSSWSFPGWSGLVYGRPPATESRLARDGLGAYASHPLLGTVGVDRGFYAPLDAATFARYAAQVPAGFRFLVKAPALVTDASVRDGAGGRVETNASHLDAAAAVDQFVAPCLEGLGDKAGVLLFQISPLPRAVLAQPAAWVARLSAFLAALPALPAGTAYAVEVRDAQLLAPRLMHALADAGVAWSIGLHDRLPPIDRQLRALDAHEAALARHGADASRVPVVARWTLHRGIGYVEAKTRYAPFDRLVDEDPATREPLAARLAATLDAGRDAYVIANNKAEGSAPLTLLRLAEAVARTPRG